MSGTFEKQPPAVNVILDTTGLSAETSRRSEHSVWPDIIPNDEVKLSASPLDQTADENNLRIFTDSSDEVSKAVESQDAQLWGLASPERAKRVREASQYLEAILTPVIRKRTSANKSRRSRPDELSDSYALQTDVGGYGRTEYDGADLFTDDLSARAARVTDNSPDPELIKKLITLSRQYPFPSERARLTLKKLNIEIKD